MSDRRTAAQRTLAAQAERLARAKHPDADVKVWFHGMDPIAEVWPQGSHEAKLYRLTGYAL